MAFKKGQTVYIKTENPKMQNTPTSGRIHAVGENHVVLRTVGGSGLYKAHKDNISLDRKDGWMHKKYAVKEEAPTVNVGSGNIAGAAGDPPVKVLATVKRKTFSQFTNGK